MKIDHVPDSIDPHLNLEQVRRDCLELIQKRAYLSAGAAVVPVPFFDVVADVSILSQLIPSINEKFGLDQAHVSVFDPKTKEIHWQELRKRGVQFSGLMVARTGVKKSLNGFISKMLTKQVTKFIPLGGQMVAAGLGYFVFKKIAAAHVDDCYQLAKKIQLKQQAQVVGESVGA
ncbi:hypothetical protein [Acinetobacter sp. MD2(2019)]|uniref:hypothetical protein n=1 Tax=Acinetobacter sp. MD2(2019) TaxID=2605273 RepID=UPI002D1E8D96|nr:hypothetical protein [Acinetobacter sp. MD2(2019)]MEB3753528.1 hypothetical protein [Acinetobacter sp. MD2(2019)]